MFFYLMIYYKYKYIKYKKEIIRMNKQKYKKIKTNND